MTTVNQTIFQFFHWYFPIEGNLWNHAAAEAERLARLGVNIVWLPPAFKSAFGVNEPGYAVYDLYDLGEFDQKGSVRTKYGTREEYLECIRHFHKAGIKVLADFVLNHKHGGDEKELVTVRRVDNDNRNEFAGEEETIEAYTRFTFPGRHGKYSGYVWDSKSFTGIEEKDSILMLQHEYSNGQWESLLENELGNFDFLMGNDIEYRNPFVREEIKRWTKWYFETTGVDGVRLDAVKHINPAFYPDWLAWIKNELKKDIICIGEYWRNDLEALSNYIRFTNGSIQLFDVPLHYNFNRASTNAETYDISRIFDNTLFKTNPDPAITFVENHDTQPNQALESTVAEWFKPLAYAMVLLREGGTPCVFYPCLYGTSYSDTKNGSELAVTLKPVPGLETMLRVRNAYAYGPQHDYFDDKRVVGWTREGHFEYARSGCAVLLSTGGPGEKRMSMGTASAGRTLMDVCGHSEEVKLDDNGEAVFRIAGGSVSVWIDAAIRL